MAASAFGSAKRPRQKRRGVKGHRQHPCAQGGSQLPRRAGIVPRVQLVARLGARRFCRVLCAAGTSPQSARRGQVKGERPALRAGQGWLLRGVRCTIHRGAGTSPQGVTDVGSAITQSNAGQGHPAGRRSRPSGGQGSGWQRLAAQPPAPRPGKNNHPPPPHQDGKANQAERFSRCPQVSTKCSPGHFARRRLDTRANPHYHCLTQTGRTPGTDTMP
jgi:hypothetical protein